MLIFYYDKEKNKQKHNWLIYYIYLYFTSTTFTNITLRHSTHYSFFFESHFNIIVQCNLQMLNDITSAIIFFP